MSEVVAQFGRASLSGVCRAVRPRLDYIKGYFSDYLLFSEIL